MKTKGLFVFSIVVATMMTAVAFHAASILPEGAQLPIHWNAAGEADDFAPALTALLLPAGMLAILSAIFAAIPRIEPLQHKLEGSAPVLRASWIGLILICFGIEAAVALPVYGINIGPAIPLASAGLLLLLIGNALPKSRPGFFVGIRTPWAIIDTDNWIATHRLAGKLFIVAGLSIIAAAVLPLSLTFKTWMVTGLVLCAAIIPFLYSWWLWHSGRSGGLEEK